MVLIAEMAVQAGYYVVLERAGVDTEDLSPTPFVEAGSEYLIGLAILAVAVAPFAEELFFRGFVFGGAGGEVGVLVGCGSQFPAVHGSARGTAQFPTTLRLGVTAGLALS